MRNRVTAIRKISQLLSLFAVCAVLFSAFLFSAVSQAESCALSRDISLPPSASSPNWVRGNERYLSEVSTIAGTGDFGNADGDGLAAAFRNPESIVSLQDGSLLIADTGNHLIRKWKNGVVTTFAGKVTGKDEFGFPVGGWEDGASLEAAFNEPRGMALDKEGNIYVADTANHAIRKIDTDGQVSTIAGTGTPGFRDGAPSEARFYKPSDVAVAADGTVYVADTLNHAIRVIRTDGEVATLNKVPPINNEGVRLGAFADGSWPLSMFNEPAGLVVDPNGVIYVSDSGNQRIRKLDPVSKQTVTVAGNPTGKIDLGNFYEGSYLDGSLDKAQFNQPQGIALDREGRLIIADRMNHRIRLISGTKVETLIGGRKRGETDGFETESRLQAPADVIVQHNGDG